MKRRLRELEINLIKIEINDNKYRVNPFWMSLVAEKEVNKNNKTICYIPYTQNL